jgi:hypothetical protein
MDRARQDWVHEQAERAKPVLSAARMRRTEPNGLAIPGGLATTLSYRIAAL